MTNLEIKELRNNSEKAKKYFMKQLAYTLGPVELKDLMDEGSVKVIDVRNEADYEISHIPGSISMPYETIEANTDKLSKEETNVVCCYNQQCHLGARACLKLADYGYPCMHLDGGFKTWKEEFGFATT